MRCPGFIATPADETRTCSKWVAKRIIYRLPSSSEVTGDEPTRLCGIGATLMRRDLRVQSAAGVSQMGAVRGLWAIVDDFCCHMPFTPPEVSPAMNCLCANRKVRSNGMIEIVATTIAKCHCGPSMASAAPPLMSQVRPRGMVKTS